MNFTKIQGAGNDFILIEASNLSHNWSQTAIAMCNRHFGVGADGLLLVLPSNIADFRMRMFNPDGSEAEVCGNGLRCLARYVSDEGLLSSKFEVGEIDKKSPDLELADTSYQEILIETISGIRIVKLYKVADKVDRIQVSMGKPKFGADDIPVVIEDFFLSTKPILDYPVTIKNRDLSLSLVSMGNPHAVYFCSNQVSDFPLSEIGPALEQLTIFPNRINFEVARVLDRKHIEARVWERGAGETLACGSGACAVAVAAQLHDYTDNKVDIKLPGGILEVEWNRVGETFLSGPAEIVFNGEWSD